MDLQRNYLEAEFIEDYLRSAEEKKLHLGCGTQFLEGWLNSDYAPRDPRAVVLDATKPFGFRDNTFDFIFTQHMIEHISLTQGQQMLSECARVLKPGGAIRISTPELAFLFDLFREDRSALQTRYIEWSVGKFVPDAPLCNAAIVINNFVRAWGHSFIYDEVTLRCVMERAGLRSIERRGFNDSEHASLKMLENEARLPQGFLELETFTLEGVKPRL